MARHSCKLGSFHGDSLLKNARYPIQGILNRFGELFEIINNPKEVASWFTQAYQSSYAFRYITFYNPAYQRESYGLFDYFSSLEEAKQFLECNRQSSLDSYFQRGRRLFTAHIYEIHYDDKDILESRLRLLGPENLKQTQSTLKKNSVPMRVEPIRGPRIPPSLSRLAQNAPGRVGTGSGNPEPIILSLSDIQEFHQDPMSLEQRYPAQSGFSNALKILQQDDTQQQMLQEAEMMEDQFDPLSDPILDYQGPKVLIHDLSLPFRYSEIYSNYLHRWVPNAEQRLNLITEGLSEKLDWVSFMGNLERMFNFYYELCLHIWQEHQTEMQSSNYWYQLMEEYLERWTPESFQELAESLTPKYGDLVDIEGYRGTGLFFLYLEPKVRELEQKGQVVPKHFYKVLPTLGEFGHLLPEPGFNLVLEKGLIFFRESPITGFQISHLRSVQKRLENGEYMNLSLGKPIYLESSIELDIEDGMDELIVDGLHLCGYLLDS